jgi:hypothetical protein
MPGDEVVDRDDGFEFRLADPELTFIRVDHQVRLVFGTAEITIETNFELSAGGKEHRLDPADRLGLGPLLSLYPGSLEEAVSSNMGVLALGFGAGASLRVPPHPHYESWQIVAPAFHVVCTPGGELAVWLASPSEGS